MQELKHIGSVSELMQLFGIEDVRNPLVEVINMDEVRNPQQFNASVLTFGFYMVVYKEQGCGPLTYGQSRYDYERGTLLFFAPNQRIGIDDVGQPAGRILVFSPELLRGTVLGEQMQKYTFFGYTSNEALHLSDRERAFLFECLKNIGDELEHDVDKHSRDLIASSVSLLLNYCVRFYDRQFISRKPVCDDLVERFEQLLRQYFGEGRRVHRLPTVSYFASQLCLSPNYFGDMLKAATGQSPQQYIQNYVVSLAESRLRNTAAPVSEIAYGLGFEYPTYFSRLFKKATGKTPLEYRMAAN